jgi:undecaprenyl pyrophosphate synthase
MGGKLEFKESRTCPTSEHAVIGAPDTARGLHWTSLIQSSNTQSLHVTGLYEFSTELFRFPKAELDRPNLICLIHQAMRNAI